MNPRLELPAEVWQNICDQLPNNRHRYTSLNNLSKTSRSLRAIAQPVLFAKFTNRYRRLVSFTKCILSFPELAEHVRELEVYGYESEDPISDTNIAENVDVGDLKYLIRAALEADIWLSEYEKLVKWLEEPDSCDSEQSDEKGKEITEHEDVADDDMADDDMADDDVADDDDASLASAKERRDEAVRNNMGEYLTKLLSVKLPNLQRLSLELAWADWCFDRILKKGRSTQTGPGACFPSLIELYVQHWDEQDGFGLSDVTALLAAPLLQIAHLYQTDGLAADTTLSVNKSLKHLRFTTRRLEKASLEKIVKAYPNLEVFEFHSAGATANDDPDDLTPRECVDALKPLVHSLKRLVLDFSFCFEPESEAEFAVDNFAHLTALESLCVDQMSILRKVAHQENEGSNYALPAESADLFKGMFPVSLLALRLTHLYTNIEIPLQSLASSVEEQLPELRELQLDFGEDEKSGRYVGVEDIIDLRQIKEVGKIDADREKRDKSVEQVSPGQPKGKKGTDMMDALPIAGATQDVFAVSKLPEKWYNITSDFNKAGVCVKIGWSKEQSLTKGMDEKPLECFVANTEQKPMVPAISFDKDQGLCYIMKYRNGS